MGNRTTKKERAELFPMRVDVVPNGLYSGQMKEETLDD